MATRPLGGGASWEGGGGGGLWDWANSGPPRCSGFVEASVDPAAPAGLVRNHYSGVRAPLNISLYELAHFASDRAGPIRGQFSECWMTPAQEVLGEEY